MATKNQIKATILEVAGNPTSGPIAALADQMAEAIIELETKKLDEPTSARKEKRVIEPSETRSQSGLTE